MFLGPNPRSTSIHHEAQFRPDWNYGHDKARPALTKCRRSAGMHAGDNAGGSPTPRWAPTYIDGFQA